MNEIIYKNTKDFNAQELQELFLSVEWSSGRFPDKLVIAMKNSETVFSAWDNNKLVGLINVLDDSIMTAYVHYLLVNPEYQGKGIGKELVRLVKEKYKDYIYNFLIAEYDENKPVTGFYEKCGFNASKSTPMYIIKY